MREEEDDLSKRIPEIEMSFMQLESQRRKSLAEIKRIKKKQNKLVQQLNQRMAAEMEQQKQQFKRLRGGSTGEYLRLQQQAAASEDSSCFKHPSASSRKYDLNAPAKLYKS